MIVIKIPTRHEFYKSILLWAYRKIATPSKVKPVGIPHNRDPDAPCIAYEPRNSFHLDWKDCDTDGHYLCTECCHIRICTTCDTSIRDCTCDIEDEVPSNSDIYNNNESTL